MADDSIDIVQPFDFHPCNSPRGMLYYDLSLLTLDQQSTLSKFKRETIREDERYLARHPEIRALIALVTRHVLLHRPRTDLHEFVATFFARPKTDIQEEMERYIVEREPHIYEGDSAVIIREESSEEISLVEEEEEIDLESMPRQLLDEVLEKAYKRLGIDVDDPTGWKDKVITSSGLSIVKEVISEVLRKAEGETQDDILKYLLETEEEPVEEEEEVAKIPKYRVPDQSVLEDDLDEQELTVPLVTDVTQDVEASDITTDLKSSVPTEITDVSLLETSELLQASPQSGVTPATEPLTETETTLQETTALISDEMALTTTETDEEVIEISAQTDVTVPEVTTATEPFTETEMTLQEITPLISDEMALTATETDKEVTEITEQTDVTVTEKTALISDEMALTATETDKEVTEITEQTDVTVTEKA